MQCKTSYQSNAITLAAQADLVLLTAEMLRSPQAIGQSESTWYDVSFETLQHLVRLALGDAADTNNQDAVPTPVESLKEVFDRVHELDREVWSDEYWRLFDSSQACTLNQASYIRRDKGTILGDVCAFYNAFGWQGNLTSGERPDHLLCQLEFTGMLLAMSARAEDDLQRKVALDALSEFARHHMHDWLPSVCFHLIETTQLAYFGAVSQWLMALWTALTDYHAWPVDTISDAPLTPNTDPEDPYECAAPDLVQLQSHLSDQRQP